MKTKEQKRKEAIERLEREPRGRFYADNPDVKAQVSAKRKEEAFRLRVTFGH